MVGFTWNPREANQALILTYHQVLEREIDSTGRATFMHKLVDDNYSMRWVVRAIGHSVEYGQRFVDPFMATPDPGMAVRLMYRHFLNRSPENEVVVGQHLVFLQANGYPKLVDNFVDSNEYFQLWGENGVPGIGVVPTGGIPLPSAGIFEVCVKDGSAGGFGGTTQPISAVSSDQALMIARVMFSPRQVDPGPCPSQRRRKRKRRV